jgi:hypothetical protein
MKLWLRQRYIHNDPEIQGNSPTILHAVSNDSFSDASSSDKNNGNFA